MTIVQGAHEKILEEPWVDETAAEFKMVLEQCREGDLEFWKREMAGAPALLELPTDHLEAGFRAGYSDRARKREGCPGLSSRKCKAWIVL